MGSDAYNIMSNVDWHKKAKIICWTTALNIQHVKSVIFLLPLLSVIMKYSVL